MHALHGIIMSSNDEEQAQALVAGQLLPPSGLDSKYIRVERTHGVFWDTAPPPLQDLTVPEWSDSAYFKEDLHQASDGSSKEGPAVSARLPLLPSCSPASGHLASRMTHYCQLVAQSLQKSTEGDVGVIIDAVLSTHRVF